MSNLSVPPVTLEQLRRKDPQTWREVQHLIKLTLDHPLPVVRDVIRAQGREAAHEILERALDAGMVKFLMLRRQRHQAPGLLVYLRGDGHYYRVVEESRFDFLKEIGAHV